MPGSLKWFNYTTNNGDTYAIFMDESNGELVGNIDTDATIPTYSLPRNVKPRTIVYASDDKRIVRRIPVSTEANFLNPANTPASIVYPITNPETGANILTLTLRRIGRIPERIRVVTSGDTGLNDGDLT